MSFPLLGFPNERVSSDTGGNVYVCGPAEGVRIIVWKYSDSDYGLNIYHHPGENPEVPTHKTNRVNRDQEPFHADDVFEVQALIFHLIQTYLPTEVTT